jgi:putative heme iron utilization protein
MPEKIINKGFESRKLIRENSFGVLSTISMDIPGYPFGSVTPYCLSPKLEPMLLISTIAQHTKNILADSKVSLTVFNPENYDVQANARLTYLGNAVKVDDELFKEKYRKYFPSSKDYFNFHDFGLFKIELKRIRYIGGFGSIFWVDENEFIIPNPLENVEQRIISHMNEDHKEAMIKYCRIFKNTEVKDVQMVGIDSEGFDLLAENKLIRFTFDDPVTDAVKAREVLVKMSGAKQ